MDAVRSRCLKFVGHIACQPGAIVALLDLGAWQKVIGCAGLPRMRNNAALAAEV
jgi:hypothetical protein